mgnify:CR=1 FL=1
MIFFRKTVFILIALLSCFAQAQERPELPDFDVTTEYEEVTHTVKRLRGQLLKIHEEYPASDFYNLFNPENITNSPALNKKQDMWVKKHRKADRLMNKEIIEKQYFIMLATRQALLKGARAGTLSPERFEKLEEIFFDWYALRQAIGDNAIELAKTKITLSTDNKDRHHSSQELNRLRRVKYESYLKEATRWQPLPFSAASQTLRMLAWLRGHLIMVAFIMLAPPTYIIMKTAGYQTPIIAIAFALTQLANSLHPDFRDIEVSGREHLESPKDKSHVRFIMPTHINTIGDQRALGAMFQGRTAELAIFFNAQVLGSFINGWQLSSWLAAYVPEMISVGKIKVKGTSERMLDVVEGGTTTLINYPSGITSVGGELNPATREITPQAINKIREKGYSCSIMPVAFDIDCVALRPTQKPHPYEVNILPPIAPEVVSFIAAQEVKGGQDNFLGLILRALWHANRKNYPYQSILETATRLYVQSGGKLNILQGTNDEFLVAKELVN